MRPLRTAHSSFVAIIPSTWKNLEVSKGFGRTNIAFQSSIAGFLRVEHDAAGVLRIRTRTGSGPDVVPVGKPILLEAIYGDGKVEWFMNGALQSSQAILLDPGSTVFASVFGQVLAFAPGPDEPDQYDVLVDDIQVTLRY